MSAGVPVTDNPFSAPNTAAGRASMSATGDAWAEGDILVAATDAVLPEICAKCGTHEGVEHVRFKAQWAPLWVRLTVLASPLVMLVMWYIFKKSCDLQVGLCENHRTQRRIGQIAGYSGLGIGIFVMIASCGLIEFAEEMAMLGVFGGIVLLLIGVILIAVMAMPLKIQKITDESAYLKGAHRGLLDAVG